MTVAALAVGAVVALAAVTGVAQAGAERVLRYSFTARLTHDVNPADARAASLVWARALAAQVGVWTTAEAQVFPDVTAAVDMINAGKTDILALSSLEYLEVERAIKADPAMVFYQGGAATDEFVLLARNNVRSAADLAGKRLAVFSGSGQPDVSSLWLDVLLMEAGIPQKGAAAPSVRIITKRSQASMALYFKQVDAAVESKSAFETAVELNPQLGRDLQVVARSPGLLSGLVCIRTSMPQDLRRRYLEKAFSLHELPQFRQTFILLRVTRLAAWDPHYLDTVRTLVARRDALGMKLPRR